MISRSTLVQTAGLVIVLALGTAGCGNAAPVASSTVASLAASPAASPVAASARPSATASVVADRSPMYRGGAGRTGEMPGPSVLATPEVLWSVSSGGPAMSSPAVADGVAYFTGGGGIWALNVRDGGQVWMFKGDGTFASSPAVAGGLVLASDSRGVLMALNAADGTSAWEDSAGFAPGSMPLVVGDLVYAGTDDGQVIADDLATGARRWAAKTKGAISHSLAAGDGRIYASSRDGSLYAFDAATGAQAWSVPLGASDGHTPSFRDGTVYVAGEAGLLAISADSGTVAWTFATSEELYPPAVDASAVYAGSKSGSLWALDRATGAVLWRAQPGGEPHAAATVVGDTLYVMGGDRIAMAYDTKTGAPRWQLQLDGDVEYAMTAVGGRMFAATSLGSLLALGPSDLAVAPSGSPSLAPSASAPADPFTGELGPAPDGLRTPVTLAIDGSGNTWVTEAGRDGFAIFSKDGSFVERWGASGSEPGDFNFHRTNGLPFGDIAFAPDGTFYVADTANFRIQRFSQARKPLGTWGAFGRADGQFLDPVSVAIDVDGTVFVSDDSRNDVQAFTPAGKYLRTIASRGTGPGQLMDTGEVTVIGGRVLVADYGNNRVAVFDTGGTFRANWAQDQIRQPNGISAGPGGTIAVTSYGGNEVILLNTDGEIVGRWATHGDWWPLGVVTTGDGTILVTETAAEGPTTDGQVRIYRPALPRN